MTVPTIGFLGTGRMGGAFASVMLKAGYDVRVWNRTQSKTEPLRAAGATVVSEAAELAGAPVVISSVMADADLVEVIGGSAGLFSRPGTSPGLLIDLSTVSTTASSVVRALCAEHGTEFLAAPVSGNHEAVLAGRASFAVSGPREAFDRAAEIFGALGRGASYVGEGETARIVKLAHNLFTAAMFEALVEVVVLAEKAGLPRARFLEFMNSSAVGSTFTRYKAPTLANLDYEPRFTTAGLLKDVDLGLAEAAARGVPMTLVSAMRPLLQSAIGHGWAGDDFNRLLDLAAAGAGLELVSEDVEVDNGLAG